MILVPRLKAIRSDANQIFWDNGARLYGLDESHSAKTLGTDAIDEMRQNYRAAGLTPSNRRYGYVHAG